MKKINNIQKICAIFLIGIIILPYSVIAQEPTKPKPTPVDMSDEILLDQTDQIDETVIPNQNFDEELPPETSQSSLDPDFIKQGEVASCFDYYEFGSITINLTQDYGSYQAGDPVMIQGTITNNNSYPVVGLDIKARLVKDIPEPDSARSEIITLEDFDIAENITLDAGKEFDVSYTHILPLNAPSGQYQLYFYAVEQDRFNLAGLSFTNDIIGSQISFDVKGDNPDHVYLDQTQIVVGKQEHNVMAFMTRHAKDSQIPVSIPLYNPESEAKEMTVTYDLYSWDSANPQNKLNTKTEQVTVPAKSELVLTYTLDKGVLPVYYLSITAQPTNPDKDASIFRETTKSNIRFVVQDTSKPRLNFTGVNMYPLIKGTEATLVTCFHNTNDNEDTSITKIETTLLDQNNKELAKTVYEGTVPSDINAIIQKFTPRKDVTQFTVVSKMYNAQGVIIDEVTKVYNCEDIDSSFCPAPKQPLSPLVIVVSIVVIIGLGLLMFKKNKVNIERV